MNRIYIFLLTALMLISLAGCGEAAPEEEKISFTYKGVSMVMGEEAAPVLEKLGEPKSYTEEPSCAFEGLDKTYYYGSFYLSTCPMEGRDCIYRIWFADDTVATEEGLRIGSTRAQAESLYGVGCFGGTNAFSQVLGNAKLTVLLENDLVSSIQLEFLFE